MQPHLRINLDSHSGRGPGAAEIVSAIRKTASEVGDVARCRLPPVRVLAHQLGISKNTVSAAYDELVAQGVIASEKRRGYFLVERSVNEVLGPERKAARARLRPATLQEPSSRNGNDDQIPLSKVFIDPELLPREKIADCFRSVLRTPGIHAFYDVQGYPPLRAAIADRLNDRGIPARPEHVLITTGSQQALDVVCRAIDNKSIATENPAYSIGKRLFEMSNVIATGVPLDPFAGIGLDGWESTLRKTRPGFLYLTTNFQNPTGYSYSTHELSGILRMSSELGFAILEDDWGSDMLSFSEFRPSLRALGGETVLYMNSFTKKLLPSLRLGYLLADEGAIDSLVEAKRVSTLGHPTIVEAALSEFLSRGYFDTHLVEMQKELDRRYQACLDALRATMPEGVRWTTPGGGPTLWVEIPRDVDLALLRQHAAARGVGITSSDESFFGVPHLHGIRIGYAYPPTDRLEVGIEVLADEIRRQLAS